MRKMYGALIGLALLIGLGAPAWAQTPPKALFEDVLMHNASGSAIGGIAMNVDRYYTVAVDVTITTTATVQFEGSAAGAVWTPVTCVLSTDGALYTTTTVSGLYQCNIAGFRAFRANITSFTAGTVTVFGRATTASMSKGGGGGAGGWPTSSSSKEITWANSLANAVRIGDGVTPICLYTDATIGPQVRPCADANVNTIIPANFTWSLWDIEGSASIVTVDPDAASKNAMYQFGANYKPVMSVVVALSPRGAATMTEENLNTDFEKGWFGTLADNNTDAFDFRFPITSKMVGITTITVRLSGTSKNAAPSGNIVLTCAAKAYRFGTDTYTTHTTTGEQSVTLTPATQYRPVATTSANITLNGTVADGGEILGSCEADATGITSAQMTDFRLRGDALIQLLANSWSD